MWRNFCTQKVEKFLQKKVKIPFWLLRQTVTLWFQLEDMFQIIVTPQGIEKVTIQLKDTPTKVYAIGAEFFYQRCP